MNNRLTNKYFRRLLHQCREPYNVDILKKQDYIVKSYIDHFINLNYQHILTNSKFSYISVSSDIMRTLYDFCPICHNDSRTFSFLCSYYNQIICGFNGNLDAKGKPKRFILLLDEETKYATDIAKNYLELISSQKDFDLPDVTLLKKIIIGTLSFCELNKKLNEFESIIKNLLSDLYQALDGMKLNGFTPSYESNDKLLEYIENLIEKTNNKILIK